MFRKRYPNNLDPNKKIKISKIKKHSQIISGN